MSFECDELGEPPAAKRERAIVGRLIERASAVVTFGAICAAVAVLRLRLLLRLLLRRRHLRSLRAGGGCGSVRAREEQRVSGGSQRIVAVFVGVDTRGALFLLRRAATHDDHERSEHDTRRIRAAICSSRCAIAVSGAIALRCSASKRLNVSPNF